MEAKGYDKYTTVITEANYEILNHAFDAITINDKNGRLLFANKAYENLCGLNLKHHIQTYCEDFVEKKIISKSVVAEVLKTKKRTFDIAHFYRTNKTALIISTPIFDENNELQQVITNVRENQELSLQPHTNDTPAPIHSSIPMQEIISRIHHVVDLNMNILITGETGTGKGVLAKYIHQLSSRREFPFVKINCAAFPDNLIESELFGYEGGAFTGAEKGGKMGLLSAADKGILFLDEIGEMPYHLQAKLLDFLQHGEFIRIGATKTTKVDVQIVAATNQDLLKMIDEKRFRKDLYYRLNVIPIRIPSLKERREEIPVFISHFMDINRNRFHKEIVMSPEVIDTISKLPFPGNVRELEHLIQALFVLSNDREITLSTLSQIMDIEETDTSTIAEHPADRLTAEGSTDNSISSSRTTQIEKSISSGLDEYLDQIHSSDIQTYKEIVNKFELALINSYVNKYGSVKSAAEVLSVHPSLIWRKLHDAAKKEQ